jgi:hypothetical protein
MFFLRKRMRLTRRRLKLCTRRSLRGVAISVPWEMMESMVMLVMTLGVSSGMRVTDKALSVDINVVIILRKLVASVEGLGFTRIVTTLKRVLMNKQ